MAKYFLLLSLVLSSFVIKAHQADVSSTMFVEQEDGSWILQVRAALTAFEYEIHEHYGKDAYATPEEFQELVISHLKDNISIYFNAKDSVVLENGFVKLGHETNAVFKVLTVPETWEYISVKNSSFKGIHKNQSALVVLKKGFAKDQFILNNENGHTAELIVDGSKFILSSNQSTTWYLYYIMAGVILGVLAVLFWKKKYS